MAKNVETLATMIYHKKGRVAHIILNRPHRGNGINFQLPIDLARCVEKANLDPEIHVIGLSGNGKGFCGGYDLVASAEGGMDSQELAASNHQFTPGSPLSIQVQAGNHDPSNTWDPVIDYQMMSRNVNGFMSLFHSNKPVIVKVHGFCVAGGTDLALCSDMIVIEDTARIGYPPARVWGTPTTAFWVERVGMQRAKRLLLTGDLISGKQAVEWGLALECAPAHLLDQVFENLLERVALMPVNQLVMQKQICNLSVIQNGLAVQQMMSVYFDGITRHTKEGYAFQKQAAEGGFKSAVAQRDIAYDKQEEDAKQRLQELEKKNKSKL